jgi:hypothetical protein
MTWKRILERCYDEKYKIKEPTYNDVTCCDEWLLYENFYEWLHSQPNFDKWLNESRWAIDKDILVKGNKVYSPSTCCFVPHEINTLFSRKNNGCLPIGVTRLEKSFAASICINYNNKHIGCYPTAEEAFYAYKDVKERYIKEIAEKYFQEGKITEKVYNALMRYEVEITD